MKEFLLFGLVFASYISTVSFGQEVANQQNGESGIQMSYSVETNDADNDNNTSLTPSLTVHHATGGHAAVWRARSRARGNRRRPTHDGLNSMSNGSPIYTARGRRYRARGRRLPVNPTGLPRVHNRQNVGTNSGRQRRIDRRRHHRTGSGRLVATGSHTVSPGSRRQDDGIDPFVALQNGQRRNGPFQDRQTAYDFLSNGGHRYRARSRAQRERRSENAQMASVMCAVFGKQFIPSAIGGRCVDPA